MDRYTQTIQLYKKSTKHKLKSCIDLYRPSFFSVNYSNFCRYSVTYQNQVPHKVKIFNRLCHNVTHRHYYELCQILEESITPI